jgi:GDP-mannose 6-dehydrogenase
MLPGSTHDVVIPALEQASGLTAGRDFAVLYNPEFLREGTSLADFADPPFTLVGAEDEEQAAPARELYATLDAPVIVAPIRETEMVKYACNAFHATKITFANEIGNLAASMGVDGRRVMEIVARDTKLNISPAYLRPGFAFGGSCLPKDLRALGHRATRADVPVPLLDSLLRSNAGQVDRALAMIAAAGSTRGSERASTRIGVLGFSFKAGTDDLRESPMVELIERLIGKGYAVRVFDRNVSLAHLQGANRAWIEREIPHIASLMADRIEDVLAASDVVVIGNADPAFAEAVAEMDDGRTVIDLVGIGRTPRLPAGYRGISW